MFKITLEKRYLELSLSNSQESTIFIQHILGFVLRKFYFPLLYLFMTILFALEKFRV